MIDKLSQVSATPDFLRPAILAGNSPSTAAITSASSPCKAKPTAIGEKAIRMVLQFLDNTLHRDTNEEAIKNYRELTEQLISQVRQASSLTLSEIKFKILKQIVTINIFPNKKEQRDYYNKKCDALFIQEVKIPDQIFNHSRRQTIIKDYSFKENEQGGHGKITSNEFQQLKLMKWGHNEYDSLFLKYLKSISLQCDKFVDDNSSVQDTCNNRASSQSSTLNNKNQQHCLNNVNKINKKTQRTNDLKEEMESNNPNYNKPPQNSSENSQNSVSENTSVFDNVSANITNRQSPTNNKEDNSTCTDGNIEKNGIKDKTINHVPVKSLDAEEAIQVNYNAQYGAYEGHKLDETQNKFTEVLASATQTNKGLENGMPNENDTTNKESAQNQKSEVVDFFSNATTSATQSSNKSEDVEDAHTNKEAGDSLNPKLPESTKENVAQNITDNGRNEINEEDNSSHSSVNNELADRLTRGISRINYRDSPAVEQGSGLIAENSTASSSEPVIENVSLSGDTVNKPDSHEDTSMVKEQLQKELEDFRNAYLVLEKNWEQLNKQKDAMHDNFRKKLFVSNYPERVYESYSKRDKNDVFMPENCYLTKIESSLNDYTATVKNILQFSDDFLKEIEGKIDQDNDMLYCYEIKEMHENNAYIMINLTMKAYKLYEDMKKKIAHDINNPDQNYKWTKVHDIVFFDDFFNRNLRPYTKIDEIKNIYEKYKYQKRFATIVPLDEVSEYIQDDRRSLRFHETDSESISDQESSDSTYLNKPQTSVFSRPQQRRTRGLDVMKVNVDRQNRKHHRISVEMQDTPKRQELTKRKR